MKKLGVRKGLSSIIAGAILLTATVMMGTGLVTWSNTNLTSYQASLTNSYSSNVNKLNENLVIENVWFVNSPKSLSVALTNVGNEGLNVTDIKLQTSSSIQDTPQKAIIMPKQQITIQIGSVSNPYIWQSKVPITITATTVRGSIFTTQVMPP
jgi:archaellum component FlaF (FlaF/FlaG flagellin family)